MFEQTFKNIDDLLHKDAGCTSELDSTEQSSWLLFLKYLDALEQDEAAETEPKPPPSTDPPPARIKVRLVDGKEHKIQHMMATSLWSASHTRKAQLAVAAEPVSRADRAAAAHAAAAAEFTDKQQAFVDFVLAQYVRQGVDELDAEKLAPLLQLKYRALNDAFVELGKPEQVRRVFVGFQRHVYESHTDHHKASHAD
jgi:hypothetical protein